MRCFDFQLMDFQLVPQVNRVGGGAQLLGTLEYANMQKMLLS